MSKRIFTAAVATLFATTLITPAHAATQLGPYFSLSGFGTLGAVQTNYAEADYVREFQAKGASTKASLLVDSNLGLQLDGKANDWLSGSVQLLTIQRTEDKLTTKAEWAFVKVTPVEGLALRAGKLGIPSFLISESRRLGYANTWLRPPNEVYSLDILNGGLTGADATYRWAVGGNSLSITGLAGNSEYKGPTGDPLKVNAVRGLNLVWDGDWYTLRAGQVTGLVKVDASYAALIPEGETLGPIYKFQGLGFTVDRANVLLQGEYVRRSASQLNEYVAGEASYLMVGYRFGSVIPFISAAEVKATDDSPISPQKTTALGLRWDAFSSAAVKFQVERVDAKGSSGASFIKYSPDPNASYPAITKPVTTFSVAVDFVF